MIPFQSLWTDLAFHSFKNSVQLKFCHRLQIIYSGTDLKEADDLHVVVHQLL